VLKEAWGGGLGVWVIDDKQTTGDAEIGQGVI
jgi:hypothetical protein